MGRVYMHVKLPKQPLSPMILFKNFKSHVRDKDNRTKSTWIQIEKEKL
jgi:hypothetical protein